MEITEQMCQVAGRSEVHVASLLSWTPARCSVVCCSGRFPKSTNFRTTKFHGNSSMGFKLYGHRQTNALFHHSLESEVYKEGSGNININKYSGNWIILNYIFYSYEEIFLHRSYKLRCSTSQIGLNASYNSQGFRNCNVKSSFRSKPSLCNGSGRDQSEVSIFFSWGHFIIPSLLRTRAPRLTTRLLQTWVYNVGTLVVQYT